MESDVVAWQQARIAERDVEVSQIDQFEFAQTARYGQRLGDNLIEQVNYVRDEH